MGRTIPALALLGLGLLASDVRAELAHCDEAVPVACGERVRGSTPSSAPPHTGAYGCGGGVQAAREKVYRLDLADDVSLRAVLSKTGGRSLNLFLLESCDERAGCIFGGGTTLDAPFLHPGTYYLVVDGTSAGDEGTFTLEVDCAPVPIHPLRCGEAVTGTLPAQGLFDRFSCGGDAGGGEAWFEIDQRDMQDLLVALDRNDVEARLFRPPLYRANRCVANGVGMLLYENPAPGRYLMAVDGTWGTTGQVQVTLDCTPPEPGECSRWEMNEGEGIITGVGPYTVHGQVEQYQHATVPPQDDPGWKPAPDPDLVQMSRGSTLCGVAPCLEALEFTYFRTFIQLPDVVEVFTVSLSHVDDGAAMLLNGQWRDDHAFFPGGVVADLLRPPGADRPGGLNEVLVVQVDDCCSDSALLDTLCYSEAGERPCVAFASAQPPPGPLCPGDTAYLDAAGTSVLDCDGNVLYQWFLDGSPLGPASTDPTAQAVLHQDTTVSLLVTCSNEPACADSTEFVVPVVPPHQPTPVGNALRALAADKHVRVALQWQDADGPFGDEHYHVLRTGFPDGPWALVSGHDVRTEAFTDTPVTSGPLGILFYDVRRAVCEFVSAD